MIPLNIRHLYLPWCNKPITHEQLRMDTHKHTLKILLNMLIILRTKSESDIQPSMVTHTPNSCSAFNPSKVHTHSSEHTHTVNTHPEQWTVIYAAAPGSSWGFGALLKGTSVRVLRVEISLPHRQSLLDRDLNSQPFDYESDSLPLGHDFLKKFLSYLKKSLKKQK